MSSDQHAELVVSSDHKKSSSAPGCGLPCTHQRAPTFSKLLERILMHLNHSLGIITGFTAGKDVSRTRVHSEIFVLHLRLPLLAFQSLFSALLFHMCSAILQSHTLWECTCCPQKAPRANVSVASASKTFVLLPLQAAT